MTVNELIADLRAMCSEDPRLATAQVLFDAGLDDVTITTVEVVLGQLVLSHVS